MYTEARPLLPLPSSVPWFVASCKCIFLSVRRTAYLLVSFLVRFLSGPSRPSCRPADWQLTRQGLKQPQQSRYPSCPSLLLLLPCGIWRGGREGCGPTQTARGLLTAVSAFFLQPAASETASHLLPSFHPSQAVPRPTERPTDRPTSACCGLRAFRFARTLSAASAMLLPV